MNTLGHLRSGESVVVFGAGPVGLVCMATARALGAKRVIAVDIVPSRLDFAKSYAATDIYLPPRMEPGEDKLAYTERNAKLMREQLGIEDRGPNSIDLVIEASGADVSIRTGIMIARIGGRFIQVMHPEYLWCSLLLVFISLIYLLFRLAWAILRLLYRSLCLV